MAEKFVVFQKDGVKFTGTMEEVADRICKQLKLPAGSIEVTTAKAGGASGGSRVLGAIGAMPAKVDDLPFYGPERPPADESSNSTKKAKKSKKGSA
jgi:hypothetical protein